MVLTPFPDECEQCVRTLNRSLTVVSLDCNTGVRGCSLVTVHVRSELQIVVQQPHRLKLLTKSTSGTRGPRQVMVNGGLPRTGNCKLFQRELNLCHQMTKLAS